jgi:hypothetical protein
VREVYGDTDVERRGEIVRGFSGDGTIEVDVVVNVGVFTEGTDLKGVETVLLARPTRSPVLLRADDRPRACVAGRTRERRAATSSCSRTRSRSATSSRRRTAGSRSSSGCWG